MRYTIFLMLMILVPIVSSGQRSKSQTRSLNPAFTPELTTYDLQLFNLNYTSMMYWYNTSMEIDSLYQLERLKVHYYSKITGIQANSYETLKQIYDNKQAIDKATASEKEAQVKELKRRNRGLVLQNVGLTIGVVGLTFSTIYFALL